MLISTQNNISNGDNLGFKSLRGLQYAKNNPRLAKVVLEMKNSKAFEKLFTDPRFDCFVKLSSTKVCYATNSAGTDTYTVPAEKCEIDIVNKNGKSSIMNNLRAWFDNSCKRYFESEIPSTTFFVNKFDEKNIGTILIKKDDLSERLSKLEDDQLVKMVDEMLVQRGEQMSTSVNNVHCIEEASKAAEEMLNNR